jgi:hypothetical protein
MQLSKYMLIKIQHDIKFNIQLPRLLPSIISIEPVKFTVESINSRREVKLEQFLVILAYIITDYRC